MYIFVILPSNIYFLNYFYFILYVLVFCFHVCLSLHHVHEWCPQKPDVGLWATMGLLEIDPASSDYCFLLTTGTALRAFTFKYKT